MKKIIMGILLFLILCTSAYAITLQDLLNFFNFGFKENSINITNVDDFMADSDGNGINDTLVFNVTTVGASGHYHVTVDLYDNSVVSARMNKTFGSGTNNVLVNFSVSSLSKSRHNFTVKVQNANLTLLYRQDNLTTKEYNDYDGPVLILAVNDKAISNERIELNITLNITFNSSYDFTAYLGYNGSNIFSKKSLNLSSGINVITFVFDNETIKKTKFNGSFSFINLAVNKNVVKANHTTEPYDFEDFAKSSYIKDIKDYGIDAGSNGVFDILRFNISLEVKSSDTYGVELRLYDSFGKHINDVSKSVFLPTGTHVTNIGINGTDIAAKKLNGPYKAYIKLLFNSSVIDSMQKQTAAYNPDSFEAGKLPDLKTVISAENAYLYGASNISLNVSMNNVGNAAAFNAVLDVYVNSTLIHTKAMALFSQGSSYAFSFNITGMNDSKITAISDFNGLVEESNETNNIQQITIHVNRRPNISGYYPAGNPDIREEGMQLFYINVSDLDNDNLSYRWQLNGSTVSNQSNYSFIGNYSNSGFYNLDFLVSDAYLNDSRQWNLSVNDTVGNPEEPGSVSNADDEARRASGFSPSAPKTAETEPISEEENKADEAGESEIEAETSKASGTKASDGLSQITGAATGELGRPNKAVGAAVAASIPIIGVLVYLFWLKFFPKVL